MKTNYVFNHDIYYHSLHPQHARTKVVPVQIGGGLISLAKRGLKLMLPLVEKHVVPHATKAVKNVLTDVINNRSNVRTSIKKHHGQFKSDIRAEITKQLNQIGKGLGSAKRSKIISVKNCAKRKKVSKIKKKKKSKTKFDYLS